MKISTTGYIGLMLPWSLSIELEGKDYPVKPLTLGDLVAIEAMNAPDRANLTQLVPFVQGLFEEPVPPLKDLRGDLLPVIIGAIMIFFQDLAKKKRREDRDQHQGGGDWADIGPWELIGLVCRAYPMIPPLEAMDMRADLAQELMMAAAELNRRTDELMKKRMDEVKKESGGRGSGRGGRSVMHIDSMDALTAFLKTQQRTK